MSQLTSRSNKKLITNILYIVTLGIQYVKGTVYLDAARL